MTKVSLLVHLLLPHESNNHRSKVLHIDSLFIAVLFLLFFNLATKAVYQRLPEVLGYATDIHIQNLLDETNSRRKEAGLTQLVINPQLSQAAAAKAGDMFTKNYWAHNSPDGKVPWDFIISSGYQYGIAGENLAKNFSDSRSVVSAWMASPTHRANVLKPGYREIGFAVVNGKLNGEETTLVVQMFGTPLSAAREKQLALAPTPQIEPEAAPAESPTEVVVPEESAVASVQSSGGTPQTVASAFAAVVRQPLFNFPLVRREFLLVFLGMMLGVLAVDAWLVARRRVVRVSGHNLAHMMFFGALFIALSRIMPGSIV